MEPQEAPEEVCWPPRGSVDWGNSGASFSKLPALLAELSGEQAQAQTRKRKAQAQVVKSQGQQAARTQGLKDSRARRDVRSTLMC